ncbi:uncharacterized protein NEMAJ01_0582 [Nematocida major]|uniref:uncharacterized protein n=1 Tax=Nematocida major TaxID=1912982 RepID=UPI0020086C53|nr:uncharacterized protein NEMAJ01_0582 [Nematocida major]KAH9385686.1 hypothetical protein NEMAJ01_0582 [Nematocida major]
MRKNEIFSMDGGKMPKEAIGKWEAMKLSFFVFSILYVGLYTSKTTRTLGSAEQVLVGGISELAKAVICFACSYWREGYESTEYFKEYLVSGVLSSFQSFSWIVVGNTFTSVILQISSQSKAFFTFIMAVVFLKRKYVPLQYFSQVFFVMGIFVPLLIDRYTATEPASTTKSNTLFEYLMLVSLPVLSACSGIFFESCICRKIRSKWKNAVNYSITSTAVSFLACAIMCAGFGFSVKPENLKKILALSSVKTLDSLLFGYIIIYYATLPRVFITLTVSSMISLLMSLQFSEPLTAVKLTSVGVTFASIALFYVPYYTQSRKA